jgi:hypothetical protein
MLRKKVEEVVRAFTGQKSAIPFGALSASDAAKVVNFVCRKGKLAKIWGATVYAQPVLNLGTGGILWIDSFRYRWFIQHGPVIALEDSESGANFTTLASDFETSATDYLGKTKSLRVRSEKWRELVFLFTGKKNKYFDPTRDDTKLFTLGLIPPGKGTVSQPTLSFSSPGAGNVPEDVFYLITWVDGLTGIESLPLGAYVQEDGLWGGIFLEENQQELGNNVQVTVDITSVKSFGYDTDRVTGWNLYRKTVADEVYKKVNTTVIPIATTTYLDNLADSSLGALLNQDNSPPPDGTYYISNSATETQGVNTIGPRFAKFWRDQLWLFGASFPGEDASLFQPVKSVLYASDVQNPDYFLYTYDVGRSAQEDDTGLAIHLNTLLIFKERSIWAIEGSNPDTYGVRQIDSKRGVVAAGSLQETPVGAIGLSNDGFVLATGYGPAQIISEEIFDEIKGINFEHRDKIISAYDPQEGKYECHVPMSPNTDNSQVFVYDVNFKSWQILKTRIGQSCKYDVGSDGSRVGLLGDQLNSRLYDIVDEDIPGFNGAAILARWHSKHFDFGDPSRLKRLSRMTIKARSKTDFVVNIDVIMDFGKETITFENVSSESTYSTWAEDQEDDDGMVWDQDNWSGEFVDRKIEIILSGVATNFQVVVRESQNSANRTGFEIEEITLEGNLLGR